MARVDSADLPVLLKPQAKTPQIAREKRVAFPSRPRKAFQPPSCRGRLIDSLRDGDVR